MWFLGCCDFVVARFFFIRYIERERQSSDRCYYTPILYTVNETM